MNWFYQTGSKTINDMNALVHDVILSPDFDTDHLQNFNASSEAKRLDDNPTCPASDGWNESSVKIRLPKTREKYTNEDDAPEVEIPGVLHRDLLQSIISAFKDPSFEAFHLKGFKQFWKPSPDEPVEEIYGEAYASEAFREMEHEVQSAAPPGETPQKCCSSCHGLFRFDTSRKLWYSSSLADIFFYRPYIKIYSIETYIFLSTPSRLHSIGMRYIPFIRICTD
jgi:hypothetical protein